MRLRICVIGAALAIGAIGILLLSPKGTTIGRSRLERNSASSLKLDTFRFPVEVLLDEEKHGTYLSIHFMFLHIDASDFTEQNLKDLFAALGAEYQDPQFMHVTAYSDKEMLHRSIGRYRDQYCTEWPEDRLPAKTGYFSAQYSRQDDTEYFSYTPDPEKPDTTTIWFRMPIAHSDSSRK